MRGGSSVDDDHPGSLPEGDDVVLERIGVGVEERGVHAVDEGSGDGLAVWEPFPVAEHGGIVGDFDEDGAVRVGDALHEHDDGERGGDEDALEQTPEESAEEGAEDEEEVALIRRPEVHKLAEIHEGGDGDDDDRREDGLGEVGEQRGEHEDGHDQTDGGDDGGERGLGARLVVHRRAAESSRHGHALEKRTRDVAQAEPEELASRRHLISLLLRDGLRDGERLEETDEGDAQRGADEGANLSPEDTLGRGESRRHLSDNLDPLPGEVVVVRHEDPEDDEEERLGQALQGFVPLLRVPREDEREDGGERHHHGEAVRVAHLVEEALEDLVQLLAALKFQSEDVLELGRADDDGGGGRETGEHRMRQKPRDELEAE